MNLSSSVKIFFVIIYWIFFSGLSIMAAENKPCIAILKSSTSADEYAKDHIATYNTLFDDVINTMSYTSLKYEILTEKDISSGINSSRYKIVILPLIINLPENIVSNIKDYISNGGKIIVTAPIGKITPTAIDLASLAGVVLRNQKNPDSISKVDLTKTDKQIEENTFPPSSNISIVDPYSSSTTFAFWNSPDFTKSPAVTFNKEAGYIAWPWGCEGNISFNTYIFKNIVDNLVPSLTNNETAKITPVVYKNSLDEIFKFQNAAEDALSSLIQADLSVPLNKIQEQIYMSEIHKALFESYYMDEQYGSAKNEYDNSKKYIIEAYARAIPSRLVEGRALWLDRGTIVSVKKPEDMKKLFDKIDEAGINIVYFETINAGYPIYPSKYVDQNPLTIGYDPLKSAIEEAHKRDIELYAWTWIFAVGNTRHNALINKSESYPGPIISNNFYEGALLGMNGNLLPYNQPEYWLDPANPEAQNFVMNLLKEIVNNYDVDGVQLDYIRYPFQSSRNLMGYDYIGRESFENESGMSLDQMTPEVLDAWTEWKAQKISNFVRDVSMTLKSIKPGLQIAAAVYAENRNKRINNIQQDWETWVENGWVDTLSPMSYAGNKDKLTELAGYVFDATKNKALVYPGLSIRQLDTAGFLEQLDTVRGLGMVGSTIFAMAHLNNDKLSLLESGPYRNKSLVVPNRDPMKASSLLLEDFLVRVHRFVNNNKIFSVSKDEEVKVKNVANELYSIIKEVTIDPNPRKLEYACAKVEELSRLTKQWLTYENNLRPGRVRILIDSLNQITSILEYAKHKQFSKTRISGKTNNLLMVDKHSDD